MHFEGIAVLHSIVPELVLLGMIFICVTVCSFSDQTPNRTKSVMDSMVMVLLGVALALTIKNFNKAPQLIFSECIKSDPYTKFGQAVLLFFGLMNFLNIRQVTWSSLISLKRVNVLFLGHLFLSLLFIKSNDVLVFMGLFFFLGIVKALLLSTGDSLEKDEINANVSAARYSVSHVFHTLFLFIGLGCLLAISGQTKISEMAKALLVSGNNHPELLWAGTVFTFAGLAGMLGVFPFSFSSFDDTRGVHPAMSSVLIVQGRFAVLYAMLHLLLGVFSQPELSPVKWAPLFYSDWKSILAITSGLAILYGAGLSLYRKSFRETLGAWSILLSGVVLAGFLVTEKKALTGFHFYLISEALSWIGCLAVLGFFFEKNKGDGFSDFKGIVRRFPLESTTFLVALGSLAGMPPFPTFVGRFSMIQAAYREGWHMMVAVTVLGWAVQLVSFSKMCSAFFADRSSEVESGGHFEITDSIGGVDRLGRIGLLVRFWFPTIAIILMAGTLWNQTSRVIAYILW